MRNFPVTQTAVVVVAGLLLAGCTGASWLNSRSTPDETQVVDGPSLVLPPHFDLRPPRQAQDYESVLRAQDDGAAQRLITGEASAMAVSRTTVTTVSSVSGSTTVSSSEAWLLEQAAAPAAAEVAPVAQPSRPAKPARKRWFWQRWFGADDDGA